MAVVLAYLLITLNAVKFEKLSLSDIENIKTFAAFEKYSVLNRKYLRHPIHMQVSQKQKHFPNFLISC